MSPWICGKVQSCDKLDQPEDLIYSCSIRAESWVLISFFLSLETMRHSGMKSVPSRGSAGSVVMHLESEWLIKTPSQRGDRFVAQSTLLAALVSTRCYRIPVLTSSHYVSAYAALIRANLGW